MNFRRISFGLFTFFTLTLCGCSTEEEQRPEEKQVKLRFAVANHILGGKSTIEYIRRFEDEHNCEVEVVDGSANTTQRLTEYTQLLENGSAAFDVMMIDVIWPGLLHKHLSDFSGDLGEDKNQFIASSIESNTVQGKIVALPWFTAMGVLYYRTDLLEKYDLDGPPETWDELSEYAALIQEGERAEGNEEFWGYLWQGKRQESLTCNAYEWQVSYGSEWIAENKSVFVNEEAAGAALQMARSWIDTITPATVLDMDEEMTREMYETGNVAFMRHWLYPYELMNAGDSAVRGKFHIAPLPAGPAGRSSTLGGWQLAVSKYSKNQDLAKKLAIYLTSNDVLRSRAVSAGFLPTKTDLLKDESLQQEVVWLPNLEGSFTSITPRPSNISRGSYPQVTAIYYNEIHKILRKENDIEAGLERIIETTEDALD